MVETPNGTRLRRNRAHLRELVAARTNTVRFSDEPMCSKQIVQQHASDQPVIIDAPESQAERKELTKGVTSIRSGRHIRVPAPYQQN